MLGTRPSNLMSQPREQSRAVIQGKVRADRRTKDLVKRLRPGDIAIIHHTDLDSTAARSLVDCRVAAVVNAARSISGRYPNNGPVVLMEAGIPLIDGVGDQFFEAALNHEGATVEVDGATIRILDGPEEAGLLLTSEIVSEQLERARKNLNHEIDAFARNTLEYLAEEKSFFLDPVDIPDISTKMRGKHVMVVVRGEGYKEDLQTIKDYVEEVRPVLIAVDGGADALLEMGLKPNLIVGDMDSVSDAALRCGAELVVHGYARGNRDTPGLTRVEKLGLAAKVLHASGTSEDVAMILADEKGASLIVAVGTHFSLIEFLDKGRSGMASTFLVRLRIGAKMVDAKGIGRAWAQRSRSATKEVLLIFVAFMVPVGVIIAYSPWMHAVLNLLRLKLGLH